MYNTIFLITLFTIWWVISLFAQFNGTLVNSLKKRDLFRLIPNWHLFAPVPSRSDYYIQYRLLFEDGRQSSWQDALPVRHRNLWCFLWYPRKRYHKVINNAVSTIKKIKQNAGDQKIFNGFTYLNLLNYLQSLTDSSGGVALQFRITGSKGHVISSNHQLIFISKWHYQI